MFTISFVIPMSSSSSIDSPRLPIVPQPSKKPSIHNSPLLPIKRTCKRLTITSPFAHANQSRQLQSLDAASSQSRRSEVDVEFQTLEGCRLGISRYPDFEYNAKGGLGTGVGSKEDGGADTDDIILVVFDVGKLYIPPLTGETTRFLGLPLPPPLKIEIVPEIFQGCINRTSGQVDLRFRSKFWFSAGSIYRAPPLIVDTTLTSEESNGGIRRGSGKRMDVEGRCNLVGVATVDPITDLLMDSFLGLPTECTAYLNATISITSSS